MKTGITALIILALFSCDKRMTMDSAKLNDAPFENIKWNKDSTTDNKLPGEWKVQLSCDGSILCNVCPEITFKANGFGTTTKGEGTVENMKWGIENDHLKITNFDNDNIVGNRDYAMTYRIDEDMMELELIEIVNSDCYKFWRTKNGRSQKL